MKNNIIAYEVLDEYRVLIQDRKGEIREYQIFHETDEGILCNDFETYINKKEYTHGLCNRE
jgi:hypothetical protein